mgnify:FL=1|tara:strand:+ start:2994 stop:3179 length:186 start_codon:yes stop_codon:yes gene_type:complete
MQFQKKTSFGKSTQVVKFLIKMIIILLILFFIFVLIDKIDFPSPNKKIEKNITNENIKVVK